MADYSASGLQTFNAAGASTSGTITLAAGVNAAVLVVGGYNYTGDTLTVTLAGNVADDVVSATSGGDAAYIYVWANPTTGSSIAWSISGLDTAAGGDAIVGAVFGVTGADAAEIAATGFPDTDSSLSETPSVTLTTAADDLCVDYGEIYDQTSSANRAAHGAGQTEIFESHNSVQDTRAASSYEKATGASVTMSYTYSSTETDNAYVAAVIPTAAVGGGGSNIPAISHHYRMMKQ